MITQIENKKLPAVPGYAAHKCILDGTLGGAGQGDVGDPRTWLPEVWRRLLDITQASTVLDVGCGAGTSLEVLRTRGWVTTGWDVSGAGRPAGTVVSEVFSAALFARPFDAVLCREVLEHVPDPIGLLRELRAATAGTLQLTTPRPITTGSEPRVYHRHHLTIWSPDRLAAALDAAGFDVVISDVWELGQRYVATPPPRNTSAPGS